MDQILRMLRLYLMMAWTRFALSAGLTINPTVLGFPFGVGLKPALGARWRRGLW